MLWQCAAKVISAFLIFAVLVLRDSINCKYSPILYGTIFELFDVEEERSFYYRASAY